jgi:soluble lytic murein transglycosylase
MEPLKSTNPLLKLGHPLLKTLDYSALLCLFLFGLSFAGVAKVQTEAKLESLLAKQDWASLCLFSDPFIRQEKKASDLSPESLWILGWSHFIWKRNLDKSRFFFETLITKARSQEELARAIFWLSRLLTLQGFSYLANAWLYWGAYLSFTFYGQLSQILLTQSSGFPPILHPVTFHNPTLPFPPIATDFCALQWLYKQDPVQFRLKTFRKKKRYIFSLYKKTSTYLAKIVLLKGVYWLDPHMAIVLHKKMEEEYKMTSFLGYPLLHSLIPADNLEKTFQMFAKDFYQSQWIETLVHAIIFVESAFNVKAVSSAGAQGAMQLMPKTAQMEFQKIVKAFSLKGTAKWDAHVVQDNVALGVSFLKGLMDEFGFNLVLVAAAYNAGAGNVRKWLKTIGDPRFFRMSALQWIEMIPFKETRCYVKKVIESFVVYSKVLNTEFLQPCVWSLF